MRSSASRRVRLPPGPAALPPALLLPAVFLAAVLLPAVVLGGAGCSARGGEGPDRAAERYPVVVRNDNFLDARLHLVYRTGNRHPLGVARAYSTVRLEAPRDLLLQDEFRLLVSLIGGDSYLIPDLVDFPAEAVRLEVRVRPVLEQSYASVR